MVFLFVLTHLLLSFMSVWVFLAIFNIYLVIYVTTSACFNVFLLIFMTKTLQIFYFSWQLFNYLSHILLYDTFLFKSNVQSTVNKITKTFRRFMSNIKIIRFVWTHLISSINHFILLLRNSHNEVRFYKFNKTCCCVLKADGKISPLIPLHNRYLDSLTISLCWLEEIIH